MWRTRGLTSKLGLLGVMTILLMIAPAIGWADQVVVPLAQTNSEGDGNNGFPFNCGAFAVPSMRYQQVYAAGEVGTRVITQIAFRQDGSTGTAFGPSTIPGVTITLSSTSNGPDTLSTTFANNVGADVTTVFSGSLTLSSAASAATPRPFDIVVPLQTAFPFDATHGKNLLLDVTIPICVTTTQFDSQNTTGDSVSRVFALSFGAATSAFDGFPSAGLVTQFTTLEVSRGGLGDALIFPLIETNNLDTLIAIEDDISFTVLARVRFRDAATGADVLNFTICLVPGSAWTASVFWDGSVTRVTSTSALLVNGFPGPYSASLAGNPRRAFMEVIGLRATTGPSSDTTVCTDATTGGDVFNAALSGRTYFVSGVGSLPVLYGGDAVALRDFATVKIADGTVFGNDAVATALIAQGSAGSIQFNTRYFVPASFSAVTQLVLSVPTGPNSASCPHCRMPSNFQIIAYSDAGVFVPPVILRSGTSVVRVISLTSSDIANDAGSLYILENPVSGSIPLLGFGIITTSPSASQFFNILNVLDNF
jgi:hypothetical protein